MTAFLTLKDTLDARMDMPYQPWFELVAPMLDLYPPEALAEVYYELECADLGDMGIDNLFVKDYNNVGNFLLEVPDD